MWRSWILRLRIWGRVFNTSDPDTTPVRKHSYGPRTGKNQEVVDEGERNFGKNSRTEGRVGTNFRHKVDLCFFPPVTI